MNTAAPNAYVPGADQRVDPGPDGVTGTADDSDDHDFYQPHESAANPDPHQQRSDARPDLQGRGDHGHQADVEAVADAGRAARCRRSRQDNLSEAISTANLISGPNSLINTSGPIATDVPVQFKLTGTYILP